MAESKSSSNKTLLIVLLVVGFGFGGLCITGVLAAIAIPAYVKYIMRSKAAEAQAVTRQVADWAKREWEANCEMPRNLPRQADPTVCCDGAKCAAQRRPMAAWDELGAPAPPEQAYFVYTAQRVDPQAYVVRAVADFTCGGPMHTVEVRIEGRRDGGDCTAEVLPPVTLDEFQ